MPIGSGLAASIGFADEPSYGTYAAPDRFLEFNSEELTKVKNTIQGGGLAAGRYAALGSRRVLTNVGGEGSIELEVTNRNFGLIIARLLGSNAAPTQLGGTDAYQQVHTLGDNFGQSMTVQKGVPDTTGTVRPYSFLGGKITSCTFECEVQGTLTAELEWDFRDVVENEALAAPSYATGLAPFHGGQMAVKLGAYGSEVAIDGVKSVSLQVERAMNTERYYASEQGFPAKKSEPIMNEFVTIGGSLTTDFVNKAQIADLFAADDDASLILEWTGPIISGTYAEKLLVRVPMVFFDSQTPAVEGPEIVETEFEFTGQHDGTNDLITIEYTSRDAAI